MKISISKHFLCDNKHLFSQIQYNVQEASRGTTSWNQNNNKNKKF